MTTPGSSTAARNRRLGIVLALVLTPIFAQRFSPQVAGSRRMCQAYS
jgi:hypothetical protein